MSFPSCFLSNLKKIVVLSKLCVPIPQVLKIVLQGRNRRIFLLDLLLQNCFLCLQIRYSLVTTPQSLADPVKGNLGNMTQCECLKKKKKKKKKEKELVKKKKKKKHVRHKEDGVNTYPGHRLVELVTHISPSCEVIRIITQTTKSLPQR